MISISRGEQGMFLFTLIVYVLLSPPVFSQGIATTDNDSISALMARGYAALPNDREHALQLFQRVVHYDSTNIQARKQLGSLYISFNRNEEALNEFLAVRRLSPSDETELQIAYLFNSLGNHHEAYNVFSRLHSSHDSAIREKARVATSVLSSMVCSEGSSWWSKMYAASYYESRFEDVILSANLYGGYDLVPSRTVSAYGTLSVTYDTRSKGGALPVIFSDNYALLGVGLRIHSSNNLFADLQFGIAHDLIERPTQPRMRGDARVLVVYGNGLFPELAIPERVTSSWKPFVDVYTSTGYYSRYKNGIGYYHARAGLRVLEWMYSSVDVYVRGNIVADTRREYFNNVVEGGVGLRLNVYQPWGASILAEIHKGAYWARQVPVDRSYNTVRIFFIIDHAFCLRAD